jgi:carbohydrate-selective porin OprB
MPEVLRRGFSRNYIGNLATISEIEARPDIRLYDAYIEQSFWGGALSLNVGQQAADVEFFDSETDDPDEHKRATSIQKHRSFGFDNCAFAAQQGVLRHNPSPSGHDRASLTGPLSARNGHAFRVAR